jgi:Cu-Zn family superoxide dismutase
MSISAPLRLIFAAALLVPIASACSPNEPVATQPGTQPTVWTGSPPPSAPPGENQGQGAGTLTADIKTSDGTTVATANFAFSDGYATVTVKTVAPGLLNPGFHGLHVHSVGKCEGDFTSAGGHFQVAGRSGHPASGDLSSLQVRGDGSAMLVTTTDAFTAQDLLGGEKTAIIIHEKSDNFANIPPDRYQQVPGGAPGPDEMTMKTGDAGKRVACGVITGS